MWIIGDNQFYQNKDGDGNGNVDKMCEDEVGMETLAHPRVTPQD